MPASATAASATRIATARRSGACASDGRGGLCGLHVGARRAQVATQRLDQEYRNQQPLSQQLRLLALRIEQALLRADQVEIAGDAALVTGSRQVEHVGRAVAGAQ